MPDNVPSNGKQPIGAHLPRASLLPMAEAVRQPTNQPSAPDQPWSGWLRCTSREGQGKPYMGKYIYQCPAVMIHN